MRLTSRRGVAAFTLPGLALVLSLVLADVSLAAPTTTANSAVRLQSSSSKVAGLAETVHLLRVDLSNKHVQLVATSPGNGINARRETVQTMARGSRVIAGINANFFDLRCSSFRGSRSPVDPAHLQRLAARLYWRTASGTNTASRPTIQISV